MAGLSSVQIPVGIYHGKIWKSVKFVPQWSRPEFLVLSKRLKPSSLHWALHLKEKYGTRIILDICDNIFFSSRAQSDKHNEPREAEFIGFLNRFDAIVTPSEFLRDSVASRLRPSMKFAIIPDAVEGEPPIGWLQNIREKEAFQNLAQLKKAMKLAGTRPGRRLVWYGHHGTDNAQNGMFDVEFFASSLEDQNFKEPLSLTIISNNRQKYQNIFKNKKFTCHYLEWNYYTVNEAIREHDIAIIPVRANEYNLAKSANRLTTAFVNGLAVCASSIGSYEPFRDIAVLDDWEEGLSNLMDDPEERQRRVKLGQEKISREYTQSAVCQKWVDLIKELQLTGHG